MFAIYRERDGVRPRFALPRSFEGEIAGRFKALAELEQQQKEVLEKQMKEGKEKLEKEVEALLHERRATLMRQGIKRLYLFACFYAVVWL